MRFVVGLEIRREVKRKAALDGLDGLDGLDPLETDKRHNTGTLRGGKRTGDGNQKRQERRGEERRVKGDITDINKVRFVLYT